MSETLRGVCSRAVVGSSIETMTCNAHSSQSLTTRDTHHTENALVGIGLRCCGKGTAVQQKQNTEEQD